MSNAILNYVTHAGVKEVPIASLIPKKIYVFFSHTIKGQKHNMPLLDEILSKVYVILHLNAFTSINAYSRTFA